MPNSIIDNLEVKSTGGYMFMLGRAAISWCSKKWIALDTTCIEAKWIKSLLMDICLQWINLCLLFSRIIRKNAHAHNAFLNFVYIMFSYIFYPLVPKLSLGTPKLAHRSNSKYSKSKFQYATKNSSFVVNYFYSRRNVEELI